MSYRVEIELDDQGRLVLPMPLAHQLGLAHGTMLVVEQETQMLHTCVSKKYLLRLSKKAESLSLQRLLNNR